MHAQVDVLPVVQPSATDFFFAQREAEWADEVEGGAEAEAGAADVACVPVDARVDEDDVEKGGAVGGEEGGAGGGAGGGWARWGWDGGGGGGEVAAWTAAAEGAVGWWADEAGAGGSY